MKISEHNIQTNEIKSYEVPDEVQPVKIFWDSLRSTRNMKLRETDVYGLSDRTMTEEMKTYRQSLRDLPANTSDPANPTWPTKPS
tara:strand:+ start:3921 stop:4175 length:255 start_codon:yes stop_codon:yes gene_type:complete